MEHANVSFLAPKLPSAPPPPPPPPKPPVLASSAIAQQEAATRAAAAEAAGGMGYDKTVASSPQGAPQPSTTSTGKALFGQ